jgi:hypothetical protein
MRLCSTPKNEALLNTKNEALLNTKKRLCSTPRVQKTRLCSTPIKEALLNTKSSENEALLNTRKLDSAQHPKLDFVASRVIHFSFPLH